MSLWEINTVVCLAQSVYRTDMPPPYPGIIGFTGNPGYASAPPAQTAPLPQQFNGQGIYLLQV